MTATLSPLSVHAFATRSPYAAASTSLQGSPLVSHNPYLSDSEHDDAAAAARSLTLPPAYVDVPMVAPGTVHTPLLGSCEFVQIPFIAPRAEQRALPEVHHSLFLGQIRFEVQAHELRWLLRRVCGVTALKIDTRGPGCFLVHLRNEGEVSSIRMLHKRLLFDTTGVWFARTADEVEVMQSYIASTLPHVSRRFRLPRDSMVVEEQKSRTDGESAHTSMSSTPCGSPYHGAKRYSSGLPAPSYASSGQSSCGDSPSLAPMTPHTPPPPYSIY